MRAQSSWRAALHGAAAALALASSIGARAESLSSALVRAYQNNPDLNQTRAFVRARDEETAKALTGMRPKAAISASYGPEFATIKIPAGRTNTGQRAYYSDEFLGQPRGATLTVSQTVFDSGRTTSAVRQSESNVFAARAGLDSSEQMILQSVVSAYMNVLRDAAILELRKNNVAVLETQFDQTRRRFEDGEVTRTDVTQAEASLAQGRSDFFAAQAALKMSSAAYLQVVGVEPRRLEPADTVERLAPKSLQQAIAIATVQHPVVVSALHQVDAAEHAVRAAESALAPSLSVNAQVSPQWDSFMGWKGTREFAVAAVGTLNVPLYQGGGEYASVRQAKELLGQARLNADLQRDAVRSNVASAYAQLDAIRASIASNEAAVRAAGLSLSGVREEARVGQRTTLDVLNAQQALLSARVNLIIAQRDRVVASYAALAAIGRLNARDLNLGVELYDPANHYAHVKDKWFGLDTPDGR